METAPSLIGGASPQADHLACALCTALLLLSVCRAVLSTIKSSGSGWRVKTRWAVGTVDPTGPRISCIHVDDDTWIVMP